MPLIDGNPYKWYKNLLNLAQSHNDEASKLEAQAKDLRLKAEKIQKNAKEVKDVYDPNNKWP